MSADFPIVDRNHRISTASKHLVDHCHPSTWEIDSREGPNDYGFDLEVQVAPAGQVRFTFRAQLKGTESPTISADGSTLSIALKRRTLNLYAQSQDDVMLVVAVVVFAPNGKADATQSKVYWTWIADELKRLRGSEFAVDVASEREEVTLRVPVTQVLTPETDVTPYLWQRRQERETAQSLADLVRQAIPSADSSTDPMERLLIRIKDRPELLSLLSGAETEPPQQHGGLSGQIAEGLSFIRAGRTALAEELVSRIDRSGLEGSPTLKAELLGLEGKICMQRRRRDCAVELFDQAYATHPVEKYQLASAEVRFLMAIDREDIPAIRVIAESLSAVKTDDGLSLLVRIQTACGEVEAAQASIDRIADAKRAMPQLVLWSSQRKWSDVRSGAERALSARPVNPHEAIALQLVAARACWQLALAGVAINEYHDELPMTGSPGLDLEAVAAAWAYSAECLRGLMEVGWPLNVELLAPIAVASAAAIGRQDEALALLEVAAAARPEYGDLQENVELLALGTGNLRIALEANARQVEGHGVLVRRACALFQLKNYPATVTAALKVLALIGEEVRQTPMALALGAAAAAKLSRPGDQRRLMAALEAQPRYRDVVFFANYATLSLKAPDSPEALRALRDGVAACPESRLLIANLFSNLAVDDEMQAKEAIALAKRMRQDAALSEGDQYHLIRAYFTGNRWQEAETEARAVIERFASSEKAHSLLAIALEMQGRTGEAIVQLEAALAHGTSKISTLQNHLGICLRLGRLDTARATLEKLLGVESERGERLELLRLNALLLAQEGSISEAYAVVQDVGVLVDPDIETEEGMYLNLFLGATLYNASVPPEELQAFWQRAAKFSQSWPESRAFRQIALPEAGLATMDGVHDMLDAVVGDSRARLREWEQRERHARSGELPVPFVARPSFVLHYIGDVFTLWDVAKRSKPEQLELHLTCNLASEKRPDSKVLRDVPLLDLTTLLVLHDLRLFKTLFRLFPRIAIPKSTIDYISQHSRGLIVSAMASGYATSLLKMVNENLERIDQPSTDRSAVKMVSGRELLSVYLQLARSGRWAVYSDDAFTRTLAVGPEGGLDTLTTVDLMRLADDEGELSAPDVAAHLGQLAKWNVGITVDLRYLIAALHGAVLGTERLSLQARLERFQAHEPFATLARAIWYPKKNPADLVQHMAAIVAGTLCAEVSDEDSVAAVWACWLIRLRIMASMDAALGWELLSFSLILALQSLPKGAEARAVRTMLKVAELAVGSDRMTHAQQDELIRCLGASVAAVADRDITSGAALRARLETVLLRDTHEGDLFSSSYFSSLKRSDQMNG